MVRSTQVHVSGFAILLLALAVFSPLSHADVLDPTAHRVSLGVTVAPLSDGLREELGYRSGVVVTDVEPGGLAHQGGVKKGDIMVVVGSVSLHSKADLDLAESRIEPGQPISVVIAREDGRLIKMMKLEPAVQVGTEAQEPAAEDEATEEKEPSAEPSPGSKEPAVASPAPALSTQESALSRAGIRAEELNHDLGAALGVRNGGVLVLQVTERSRAALAGIKAGDVITSVGAQKVWGVEHVNHALEDANAIVAVTLRRQGVERRVEIRPEGLRSPMPDGLRNQETERADKTDPSLRELGEELRTLREEVRRLRAELESLKENGVL